MVRTSLKRLLIHALTQMSSSATDKHGCHLEFSLHGGAVEGECHMLTFCFLFSCQSHRRSARKKGVALPVRTECSPCDPRLGLNVFIIYGTGMASSWFCATMLCEVWKGTISSPMPCGSCFVGLPTFYQSCSCSWSAWLQLGWHTSPRDHAYLRDRESFAGWSLQIRLLFPEWEDLHKSSSHFRKQILSVSWEESY